MEQKIPAFLQDLPVDDVLDALYWLVPFEVEYGTVLMEPGEEDGSIVIVAEGELVAQCDGTDVACIGPGGIVGEIEMFARTPRAGRVKAVRPSHLLVLEREGYEALRDAANPVAWAVEREVVSQLATRLRSIDERMDVLAAGGVGEPIELAEAGWVERVGRWLRRGVGTLDVDVAPSLAALPTFAESPAGSLEELAERCAPSRWREGRVLCRQHEPADRAWIVLDGSLSVVRHVGDTAIRVGALGAGDVGGATSLLSGSTRCATLVAAEETLVLEIGGAAFQALVSADDLAGSAFRVALIRSLAQQLGAAELHLAELDAERRRQISASLAPLRESTVAP